jgi:ribonucleoside-diphosphate reductase alpha chain
VSAGDFEVVERLTQLAKALFGIQPAITAKAGYDEVALHSVRLAEWWVASGFAKQAPQPEHRGKGYLAHIPDAVLHTNEPAVYTAFLRGLYEADGTVTAGIPTFTSANPEFVGEVQSLLLALGYPTTRKHDINGMGSRITSLRLLNTSYHSGWLEAVGFLSSRKSAKVVSSDGRQAARKDRIPVTRALIDRVAPTNGRNRRVALLEFSRHGAISRRLASELHSLTSDAELEHLLGFVYDVAASADLGDEELTYDISVPENVTYLANGFVNHNTISFLMDCDTTGIEPDLGLVKTKKLVGGGTMSIVNQTIPRALTRLGYTPFQIDNIVEYIEANMSIVGAPHLKAEHLPVFACSMGDNVIHYMGHVRMMAAAQPFISGAISKTANVPETATVEDIEELHMQSWKLGLKAIAIYRDNCKVAQPLATTKKEVEASVPDAQATSPTVVERVIEKIIREPVRQKLPRTRHSRTFEFRVADCKGFVTVGEYDDGRPGEIFLRVSKQGSTLAGIMDAFAISISHGLQYGVPLRAFVEVFTNMRFEPAGMTDDPEIRFASSLMDYLFRKLALEYLSYDERAELNIMSVGERLQPTLPGVEETVVETTQGYEMVADPKTIPSASELATQIELGLASDAPITGQVPVTPSTPPPPATPTTRASDAPICMQCGVQMNRAGSCYACPSCGSTSGCS